MIDFDNLHDQLPQVSNRSIVQLIPTKLYLDWYNYVSPSGHKLSIHNLESISFLIEDFETQEEFDFWLECNYQLLFEVRLNYSCIDKSQWPENRTFSVFRAWFEVYHSSLVLDLGVKSIEII